MADPLIETIVARVARVLTQDLVRDGDVPPAAGLQTQFSAVFRALVLPEESPVSPRAAYACVLTGSQGLAPRQPMQFVNETVDVEVYVFVQEGDLNQVDSVRNRAVADVKKAILRDSLLRGGQTSQTAGGIDGVLVDQFHYVGVEPYAIASDQPTVEGALVRFRFEYLHEDQDPYAGRPG